MNKKAKDERYNLLSFVQIAKKATPIDISKEDDVQSNQTEKKRKSPDQEPPPSDKPLAPIFQKRLKRDPTLELKKSIDQDKLEQQRLNVGRMEHPFFKLQHAVKVQNEGTKKGEEEQKGIWKKVYCSFAPQPENIIISQKTEEAWEETDPTATFRRRERSCHLKKTSEKLRVLGLEPKAGDPKRTERRSFEQCNYTRRKDCLKELGLNVSEEMMDFIEDSTNESDKNNLWVDIYNPTHPTHLLSNSTNHYKIQVSLFFNLMLINLIQELCRWANQWKDNNIEQTNTHILLIGSHKSCKSSTVRNISFLLPML